jgi:malate dehydrogenase (oxaloacetate-decarboxylating)
VLAGLINAMKVTGKQLADCKIVLVGAGAAGVAIAKLLHTYANPSIIAVDSKGIISSSRTDLNPEKQLLATLSKDDGSATLEEALKGADVFIGVSRAKLLSEEHVKRMAKDPIIFALANPEPEILPEIAKAAGAKIIATGRSDYPNQVNNVLAFPGLFRGALDTQSVITDSHKTAAAEALAAIVSHPTEDKIIPHPLEDDVVAAVAGVFNKS